MNPESYDALYHERNFSVAITFTDRMMAVTLHDERVIHVPLSWFPWLESANADQRAAYRINNWMVNWDDVDEGFTIETLLLGRAGEAETSPPDPSPCRRGGELNCISPSPEWRGVGVR